MSLLWGLRAAHHAVVHSLPVGAQGYIFHTQTCSGQQTTPAGVVGGAVQSDREVEWGPGTADQEDTNTPLGFLPHRPLEVLLTSLWCSAESREQSVVPHLTCTTPLHAECTAGMCGQWPTLGCSAVLHACTPHTGHTNTQ